MHLSHSGASTRRPAKGRHQVHVLSRVQSYKVALVLLRKAAGEQEVPYLIQLYMVCTWSLFQLGSHHYLRRRCKIWEHTSLRPGNKFIIRAPALAYTCMSLTDVHDQGAERVGQVSCAVRVLVQVSRWLGKRVTLSEMQIFVLEMLNSVLEILAPNLASLAQKFALKWPVGATGARDAIVGVNFNRAARDARVGTRETMSVL
jgi:hypothetical protein